MENWLRSQCDIYNYRVHTFKLSSTIKSLFKTRETEKDNLRNCLIEENNNSVTRNTTPKKSKNKEKSHGTSEKISSRNSEEGSDNPIWRRLSLQSYRKRRQQRQEEKSKPVIPAVLRTYDIGGMQKKSI